MEKQRRLLLFTRRCNRGVVGAPLLLLALFLTACTPEAKDPGAVIASIYSQSVGAPSPDQIARDTALFDWATELGLAEEFTREQLAAPSEYGARTVDAWDQYQDYRESVSQDIRGHIRDGFSLGDVQAYYDEHPDEFARQDILELELSQWESGRVVSQWTVTVDESNVRDLQESDDSLYSVALSLEPGTQATVAQGDGHFVIVRALSRTAGGHIPFDEVVQATASKLAHTQFEAELDRRAQR